MSFDVDAFMSMPAPPQTRASQSAPTPETGPSFDDHLNETEAPELEAKAQAKPNAPEGEDNNINAEPAAAPQAPATNAAPPMVIQLIASAEPIAIEPTPGEASAPPASDAHPQATPPPPEVPIAPQAPSLEVGAQADNGSDAAKAPDSRDGKAHIEPAQSGAPKAAPSELDVAVSDQASAAPVEVSAQPQAQALAQPPVIASTPQTTQDPDKRPTAQAHPIAGNAKSNTVDPRAALSDGKDAKAAKPTQPQADTAKTYTPQPSGKDSFSAMLAPRGGPEPPTLASSSSAALTNAALAASSAQNNQHTQESATAVARAGPIADQLGREIIRRFNGGSTFFELRLDPPEMGRIEVRLEVSRDHRVTAIVAADNPQALADLARHARDLEAALQSAGLELSDQGLSFDLSQQRESRTDAEETRNGRRSTPAEGQTPQSATPLARPIGLERWRGVRVDVMA